MKRCPKCSRVYADNALNFCLDDGEWLIDEAKRDEGKTELLPSTESLPGGDERPTRVLSRSSIRVGISKYWLIAAIVAITVGGSLFFFYKQGYLGKRSDIADGTVSFETMKMNRMTTTGRAISAAISPDGKYIAYVNLDVPGGESGAGRFASIWVKQVVTGQNIKIVDSGANIRLGLTFSPDSNYLYYRSGTGFGAADLFRISVLGGDAQKISEDLYSSVSFSPDGTTIAFIRNHRPVMGESNLIVAKTDGSEERVVSTHGQGEIFATPIRPTTPVWSPDGKHLICALGRNNGTMSLMDVSADRGEESQIGSGSWSWIDSIAFLPGGDQLLLAARDPSSPQMQIWQVSYPSGVVHRVTNDLSAYQGISLSQNGRFMAVTQTTRESELWLVRDGKTNDARPLTTGAGRSEGYWGLSWTPDGKIVYVSSAGDRDIWILDPERTTQKQLTSNAHQNFYPLVTADGRYILFASDRGETFGIWRMNMDGTNARQIVFTNILRFTCSPDSQWIVYSATSSRGFPVLWKVSIDGGQPTLLNDEYWEEHPTFTSDGKLITFQYFGPNVTTAIGQIPADGGTVSKIAEPPLRIQPTMRLTPDGSGIAYIDFREGVGNIWALPIRGGPPKQLTDFKSDAIFWFDWSRDGRNLALSRGTEVSDVVLISNSK